MKNSELSNLHAVSAVDELYPEEIVVKGEEGYEYGLPREEETGLVGAFRNIYMPERRKIIEPEVTTYRQRVDSAPGVYDIYYQPAKYEEAEVGFEYAPVVRGTKAAFNYAKSLFISDETRSQAAEAIKQSPEIVSQILEDQMTAAVGMTQGAEKLTTPEGREITYDPLLVTGAVAPSGIAAARIGKQTGDTVLGIFGGHKGRSSRVKEEEYDLAKDDFNPDDYDDVMDYEEDIFQATDGVFYGEDGNLRYEIPTAGVKFHDRFVDSVTQNIPDQESRRVSWSDLDDDTFLNDVIDFPELFDEYPVLKGTKIELLGMEDIARGVKGEFSPWERTIRIAPNMNERATLSTLLHEIQHQVDFLEDRQHGAFPEIYLPKDFALMQEAARVNATFAAQQLKRTLNEDQIEMLGLEREVEGARDIFDGRGFVPNYSFKELTELGKRLSSPEYLAKFGNPVEKQLFNTMTDEQRLYIKTLADLDAQRLEFEAQEREAMIAYLSTPGEVDARNVEKRFRDQLMMGDLGRQEIPTRFADTSEDGVPIVKDLSLPSSKRTDLSRDKAMASLPPNTRIGYDANNPVFHLTDKDFDIIDVVPSGERADIGFHVGTAAQASARGETRRIREFDSPERREALLQLGEDERIMPMALKAGLNPLRIPDMSSFKEPANWLESMAVSKSSYKYKEAMQDDGFFRTDDDELIQLKPDLPEITVGGETYVMLPEIKGMMDESVWRDFITEAVTAERTGGNTITNYNARKEWADTLVKLLDRHGYDRAFVYRNKFEGTDEQNLDALVEQIQRANRGEIDGSEIDLDSRFADSYMLMDNKLVKGLFGGMTESEPQFMRSVDVGTQDMAEPLDIGVSKFNIENSDKLLKNYTADDFKSAAEAAGTSSTAGSAAANKKINAPVAEGSEVSVRLNLNSKIDPDGPAAPSNRMQTIHPVRPNGKPDYNKADSYMSGVTVENGVFDVNQAGRRNIAETGDKVPAASVQGKFTSTRNVLEEGGDIVEIGMNPKNLHLFIDLKTGQAVRGFEAATIFRDRVYAKGVTYWKKAEAPEPLPAKGDTPIDNQVRYKMKRGGLMARQS